MPEIEVLGRKLMLSLGLVGTKVDVCLGALMDLVFGTELRLLYTKLGRGLFRVLYLLSV